MKNTVTPAMQKAGKDIADALFNAGIAKGLGGLGGSMTWDEFMSQETPNRDLVLAYLEDEIDSVTAIYIAMERAA